MKNQIIFSITGGGKMGEVRPRDNGMVAIFLDALYWPEVTRDGKEGEQFMGEFHSFESFQLNGSFGDLTLIDNSQPTTYPWGDGGLIFCPQIPNPVTSGHSCQKVGSIARRNGKSKAMRSSWEMYQEYCGNDVEITRQSYRSVVLVPVSDDKITIPCDNIKNIKALPFAPKIIPRTYYREDLEVPVSADKARIMSEKILSQFHRDKMYAAHIRKHILASVGKAINET